MYLSLTDVLVMDIMNLSKTLPAFLVLMCYGYISSGLVITGSVWLEVHINIDDAFESGVVIRTVSAASVFECSRLASVAGSGLFCYSGDARESRRCRHTGESVALQSDPTTAGWTCMMPGSRAGRDFATLGTRPAAAGRRFNKHFVKFTVS